MILPNFCLRSLKSFARDNIAITSDATVMSKPVSLGYPSVSCLETAPTVTFVNAESFRSTTLLHETVVGSMLRGFFLLNLG
jgi:hypothetical protein